MRQLGGPPATETCRLSPSYSYPCRAGAGAVPGLSNVISLASGALHTCAVSSAGEAYCWGSNRFGELGSPPSAALDQCRVEGAAGTLVPCSGTPLLVAGGLSFRQITAGASFTCALTQDGAAYCWGLNGDAQLGNAQPSASTPVPVQGGNRFTAISSGTAHTCGVTTDDRVLCWGSGRSGQLGNGSLDRSYTPVAAGGGMTFRSVTSGAAHTCAVSTAGDAFCWGDGANGELGAGPGLTQTSGAVRVEGGLKFERLSAGVDHTCGISTQGGVVYCWGDRRRGAVGGDVVTASYFTPQPVPAPGSAGSIRASRR
jgi:alpha-tubulin suppressor-like RCC1 family protein